MKSERNRLNGFVPSCVAVHRAKARCLESRAALSAAARVPPIKKSPRRDAFGQIDVETLLHLVRAET